MMFSITDYILTIKIIIMMWYSTQSHDLAHQERGENGVVIAKSDAWYIVVVATFAPISER